MNAKFLHRRLVKYRIDMHPAIVLHGDKEYWVRYFGIPSGYEFGSLVEDIVDVSRGEVELEERVKAAISAIDEPVHIKVFVTPTDTVKFFFRFF